MSVGSRIKEMRAKHGMTQPQLSEKLELSLDMVKSLEMDRSKPSIETLNKLCDVLDCTSDFLLGRTKEPELFVIETWDDFHRYMDIIAHIIGTTSRSDEKRFRENMNKYPRGIDSIPPDREKQVTYILNAALAEVSKKK